MKRFLLATSILLLVLGIGGSALAIPFTDYQELGVWLGEGTIAGEVLGNTYTYTHDTPADLEVPYDLVTSATLTIVADFASGSDDTVTASGSLVGTLENGSWHTEWYWFVPVPVYDGADDTVLDVLDVFSSWDSSSVFDVIITANGSFLDGVIYLRSSTLSIEYENVAAPVPEPATMLLLGTGLIGLAVGSRKKFPKK